MAQQEAVTLPTSVAGVEELYNAYMLGLYPRQPGMCGLIIVQGQRLMRTIDDRRHAKCGSEAVGLEALAAEATGLFGAVLAELGVSMRDAATHSAQFGVRVRGVVHQP